MEMAAVPLFADLDEVGWTDVLGALRRESPAEGECVQAAGRPMTRLVVVVAGGLRIVHTEADGHARVVRLLGPGDHLGETPFALRHLPVHSAFAMPGTTLGVLSHRALEEAVRAHPPVLRALFASAQRRLLAAELLLSSESGADVSTRLTTYLLSLPGLTGPDGWRSVRLPGTQADVASFLGTTPETLSRRLRDLVHRGAVRRLAPGTFALDPTALAPPPAEA